MRSFPEEGFYFIFSSLSSTEDTDFSMWISTLADPNRRSKTSFLPCMPVGPKPWRVRKIAWSWCSAWSRSLFCCTKAQRHTFSRLREGFPRSMRLIDWEKRMRGTYYTSAAMAHLQSTTGMKHTASLGILTGSRSVHPIVHPVVHFFANFRTISEPAVVSPISKVMEGGGRVIRYMRWPEILQSVIKIQWNSL